MPDNPRPFAAMSLVWAAAAAVAAALAVFLAAHHPIWPAPIAAGLVAWMIVAYRFPGAWLFALPACLPALNFSPWTGWIGIEELDLFVLATVAGGYARLASAHYNPFGPGVSKPRSHWPALAVAVVTLLGLQRGIADAGGWSSLAWYQSYAEALNSLRVGKSAFHALLLLPLLGIEWRTDRARAFRRFALGMVCGAGVLTLAVLWERAAFPGLFNLLAHYRTVGWFWEMHVGGAAIDAYVVLTTPFVAWALWAARVKWVWLAAALFALLWAYAVMTTFSRGAYLGVATTLMVLGLQLPMTGGQRWWPAARALAFVLGAALLLGLVLDGWGYSAAALALVALGALFWLRWRARPVRRQRSLAAGLLLLALIFEAVVMLGPDSFMSARLARNAADYESRTAHWGRGIALLEGPADWLFGLGLGRLPAHYARSAPGGELSGAVAWQGASEREGNVRIAGPRTRAGLGGRFGLTQRVPLAEAYRVQMDLRSARAVTVYARVCESHLLYDRGCQAAFLRLPPSRDDAAWQHRVVVLRGPPLSAGRALAPRQGVFTLAVLDSGGQVDFDNLVLETRLTPQLLANGDFAAGLAHWLPAAQIHFVPWHIDNLVLELLIERGLIGAVLLLGLGAAALLRLLRQTEPGDSTAPFIAASLCGVACVGLMSSVLDVPRVALLLALLLAMGLLRVK
jgi:hypothetical protein